MNLQKHDDEESGKFLLEELKLLEADRLRLKAEAGQRLNFFLSLSSAIVGGLVIFGQSANVLGLEYIIVVALLFLSLIGWQTFTYIVGRDISTDRNLRASGRIRRYFSDKNPACRAYLMRQDDDEPTSYITNNKSTIRRTAESVLAFLLAFAIGIFTNILGWSVAAALLVTLISFVCLLVTFELYSKRQFNKAVKIAEAQKQHRRTVASVHRERTHHIAAPSTDRLLTDEEVLHKLIQ